MGGQRTKPTRAARAQGDAMEAIILAGDIGGTKIHLGLYRADQTRLEPIRDQIYHTRQLKSLAEACADFSAAGKERIRAGCFGVPGPVIDGAAQATNVPWEMRESALEAALGAPVRLVNDLCATAYGVIHLADSEFEVLQRGRFKLHQGNVAVIAAGTGLGEAALVFESAGNYHAVASEGGHADFAPRDEEQFELHRFLAAEFGHVSVERVAAGPGIFNIYRFLRRRYPAPEPEWLAARLGTEDPNAVVSEMALAGRDPRCVRALEMFVEVYGAEAGNLALKMLALGGVYIGGGVAPKILPMLKDGRFTRAFNDKGRLAETLSKIEVRVSLNQSAGLLGAAYCAAAML
jgi:glucokinase